MKRCHENLNVVNMSNMNTEGFTLLPPLERLVEEVRSPIVSMCYGGMKVSSLRRLHGEQEDMREGCSSAIPPLEYLPSY